MNHPKALNPNPKRFAPFLWILLGLFLFRVTAHFLVIYANGVSWLPPQQEWLSGAVRYEYLLIVQIAISTLFLKICVDFTRARGISIKPNQILASWLPILGLTYLGIMLIRYAMRMALYPPERWTGGAIPIFFHCVLATFILIIALYHVRYFKRSLNIGFSKRMWISRIIISAFATFLILTWIIHTLMPTFLGHYMGIGPAKFAVSTEKNVSVITSDGTKLVANIYRPRKAEPSPTILVRAPFNIPKFDIKAPLKNRILKDNIIRIYAIDLISRMWAERGYNVVFQGTRGRGNSEGIYHPFIHEREDGVETLNWLFTQPWFDGRLGMWGASYYAYTLWVISDETIPGPSTMGIQLASTDWYSMFYVGGAFSLESALHWALLSRPTEDVWVSPQRIQDAISGFPLIQADERALYDIPFFNDWVTHTEKDSFWEKMDDHHKINKLQGPVHLTAGWFDPFLPGQLKDFMDIKEKAPAHIANESRLVIGPWAHAQEVTLPGNIIGERYRTYSFAPSFNWFDKHLKQLPVPETSPVRIFVMGENIWRNENEWPLARTQYSPYYLKSTDKANTLHGDGSLTTSYPTKQNGTDTFTYDPFDPVPSKGGPVLGPRAHKIETQNQVEIRNDVLIYDSKPLPQNLEVTGPVMLDIYVSTTAPSTDFTAKLVDVHPDGSAYYVSEGILRLHLDENETNAISGIRITLWPTSIVFKKDHVIRLEVSSSSYPRFDRNPNTGKSIPLEKNPISAQQTIYHGKTYPSNLILPIIPR
tara:strand:+ start:8603 stop:10885 length:2283 start_codon:yes stop_codon:yes gene_type:complete